MANFFWGGVFRHRPTDPVPSAGFPLGALEGDGIEEVDGVDGLELGDSAGIRANYLLPAADGLELGDSCSVNLIAAPVAGHSSLRIRFG